MHRHITTVTDACESDATAKRNAATLSSHIDRVTAFNENVAADSLSTFCGRYGYITARACRADAASNVYISTDVKSATRV